ncbi:long-chain fatty acid--CoA ligase [Flavisphingomonas formosensis]|uniref:long-chain fatty acid--CoA ligase n=1 Tax=Flavisphingomonas formosensis TaxID=861534 RepID=UPI0012F924B2|nr:long-chain fatty acid--CoA ligase [Sphingomonas formosensis]
MLGSMQDWPLRLTRLFDYAAREHGRREIVSHQADGTTVRTDWAGVVSDGRRLAGALTGMGIRPGDRVATLAMNHVRHLVSWIGAIGAGAVIHTINPRLFDDQIVYIVNHAGDRVLIHDAAFAPIVARIRDRLETVEHIIGFEESFDALVESGNSAFSWVEGDERDPAMLCYTSGTTGNPKGVLYDHRSQLLHMMTIAQPNLFGFSSLSVALPVTPMFHAGAWGVPFAAAGSGSKLVLSAVNDAPVLCKLISEEGVTFSCGVPTVWLAALQHVDATGGDFGMLKAIATGGSAAPRAMIERFLAMGIEFGHLWGMTEMSPVGTVCAYPPEWEEMDLEARIDLIRCQGKAPFGVELRIVDEEGRALPRDGKSAGQLQARGAWTVDTYYRDERGPAVDADGWFDTGDIAVLHPDGVLQLTDRAKDVIKSGGEWISSVELENAAVGCPGVAEAAAIGVPHPKWDERPLLLVVRKPGDDVCAAKLRDFLGARVAKWWLPDEILFVESLPHTGTGKLLKTALREQYRNYKLPGC